MKLSLPPQPPAFYTVVLLMNRVDAILYILMYICKMPLNLIVRTDILSTCFIAITFRATFTKSAGGDSNEG